TIDPADGDATLWFSTFGGGAWEVERRCAFITDHSTISKYEVDAALAAGNGTVRRVAHLELDGFLGEEVGLLTTADVPQVTVTAPGVANPGVTAVCRPPQHDVP